MPVVKFIFRLELGKIICSETACYDLPIYEAQTIFKPELYQAHEDFNILKQPSRGVDYYSN